jgi:hypothetical protein
VRNPNCINFSAWQAEKLMQFTEPAPDRRGL